MQGLDVCTFSSRVCSVFLCVCVCVCPPAALYLVSLIHFHLSLYPTPLISFRDILRQGDSEGCRKNKRAWWVDVREREREREGKVEGKKEA